jgi:hypothetical protein
MYTTFHRCLDQVDFLPVLSGFVNVIIANLFEFVRYQAKYRLEIQYLEEDDDEEEIVYIGIGTNLSDRMFSTISFNTT